MLLEILGILKPNGIANRNQQEIFKGDQTIAIALSMTYDNGNRP
jgi:hypothetical protein